MSVLTNIINALANAVSSAKSSETAISSGDTVKNASVGSQSGMARDAVSGYDDRIIKNSAGYTDGAKDIDLIAAYQTAWQNAKSQAERDAYHEAAEAIRSKYGYSGGSDGSMYIDTGGGYNQSSYTKNNTQGYYPPFLSREDLEDEYESIARSQISAINNSISSGVNILNSQKASVNSDFDELARAAYVANRISKMNLPQQLSASGISGGAAESTNLGLLTSYESNLNENERQRLKSIKGIEDEITNLKLKGKSDIAAIRANAGMAALEAYQKQLESELDYYKWQQDYNLDKASFDYDVKSDSVSSLLSRQKYEDSEKRQEYENQLQLAKIMAGYGDFSMFDKLGIDSSLMAQNYAASKAKTASASKTPSASGGSFAANLSGAEAVKVNVINSVWESAGNIDSFYSRIEELMQDGIVTSSDLTLWMIQVAAY